jgi:hypothetical protein
LPTTSTCGICKKGFQIAATWLDDYAQDASPPPCPVVCKPCIVAHEKETFSCARCKVSKLRWYRSDGTMHELDDDVRSGRFEGRHTRKKVCRVCSEDEFLDDIIGLGLFHTH